MSNIRACCFCRNTRKSSIENKIRCTRYSKEMGLYDVCKEFQYKLKEDNQYTYTKNHFKE